MPSTKPKRHHWWPQLQSNHWVNADGCINCYDLQLKKVFASQPINIGVQGHLYSKDLQDGGFDPSIEIWFAEEIDTPFSKEFDQIFDFTNIKKQLFRPVPEKIVLNKKLGFDVDENYRHLLPISKNHKLALSSYLAGLIVRTPRYIEKLVVWHSEENSEIGDYRNLALENMRWLHGVYEQKILNSDIMIFLRTGTNEFLYGDNAVHIQEPWRPGPLPFDVYGPMTPDFSVSVLPTGSLNFPNHILVSRAKNKLVARYNHKIIAQSQRFIFSRSCPPIGFIEKSKNKKVPAPFGIRKVGGSIEVTYDKSRDR